MADAEGDKKRVRSDDEAPAGFVKRKRVIVRSVRVKKSDVPRLLNRETGEYRQEPA